MGLPSPPQQSVCPACEQARGSSEVQLQYRARQCSDRAPLVIEAVFKTQSTCSVLSHPVWTWDGRSRWCLSGGWALPPAVPRRERSLQGSTALPWEAASQGDDGFEEPAGQFYHH